MAFIPLIFSLLCQSVDGCETWEITDTLAMGVSPGHLSHDGRLYYFGVLDEDDKVLLHRLRRRSLKARWKGPHRLEGPLNDTARSEWMDNMQPAVSGDGLRMVYVRNPGDGWETNDLWMAARSAKKHPFDSIRPLDELNTDGVEAYPFLTEDGNRLYYTASGGLMVSDFDQSNGRFSQPVIVDLPWDDLPTSCWLSDDELTIMITILNNVILVGQRASVHSEFSAADSIFLPEGFYVSSPSLDPRGELYVYASIPIYASIPSEEEASGVRAPSLEPVHFNADEMDDVELKTETYIFRLRCKGGM